MPKYIFFDVDGTLSTKWPFTIPESTKKAIRALRKNGHFVSIATGRPIEVINPYAKTLDIDTYVCNGGAVVVKNYEKIIKEELNQELCFALLEYLEERHIPYAVSVDEKFTFLHRKGEAYPEHIPQHFIDEVMRDCDFNIHELPTIQRICVLASSKTLLDFGHKEFIDQGYDIGMYMIEPDDKYRGIELLMDHFGYPKEDIVVFGDGENDMKMFNDAPLSIAMGNSVPPLKEIADYVTSHVEEDGILNACLHFGWIQEKDL
ncbi:MAG: Cof-type HAD-IIB family hydrolase [Bacillota bacterium]|nr:Cof-type HAD-IIB family hydrolase [Bacillota bacterium]